MARGTGGGLVARRALANPAPVLSVAINVLVVCTLVSGLAASLSLLQRDALRSALSRAPAADTVLTVNSPYDDDDPAAQDAALREALAPLLAVAGGDVVVVTRSATYDVASAGPQEGVSLASVSAADQWLEAVTGELPTAQPGPLEVAVPAGSGREPGDRVTLLSRTDAREIEAVVTGTWRTVEERARWVGTLDAETFLVDPDRFARVAGSGTQGEWRAVPDLEALQPTDLAALSAAADVTVTEVAAAGEAISASVRADTGLVPVLADRARELSVLRALLLVPAALLMLVAAAGLLLVAAGLADVRREEEALLRSRGAGYRQLAAPTVVETIVVCATAAAVAPLLASALIRIGDIRPPVVLDAWVGSSVAAALCALALSLPVVVRAVTGDRAEQLAAERQRRRRLTLLLTALMVVTGAGVLAVTTLRGFGDTVGRTTVLATGVDPLLVASPALVLLALAGLVCVLLLPPVFRLLATAAATRGVPLAIGVRFASSAPARAVPVALATTLAVGTLAFAAVERASSSAAREARAEYVAGAPVRLDAPAPAARAGADAEERELSALPGVSEVHPVYRSGVFIEGLPADVLVTDVGEREALFGPDVGEVDLESLTRSDADDEILVMLNDQLASDASLRVDDTFTLPVLGVPTQVRVAATVPYVRTVADGRGVVLADTGAVLPLLANPGDTDGPDEWWLGVAEDDVAAVADALAERPDLADEVITREAILQRLDNDPSTGGAALGRVLLLTGGGCLVVGALLLSSTVLLRRRERATEAWMLRAAGADRRQLTGVLGWEYAVVTGGGVVAGLLAGTSVAAITLVSMTLGPDGQLLVPPPALVLPWPILLGAPLTMAAAPLLLMLWLVRRDHHRTQDAGQTTGAGE